MRRDSRLRLGQSQNLKPLNRADPPAIQERDHAEARRRTAAGFKGDDYVMNTTLFLLTKLGNPPVTLGINGGEMTVTSDLYNVRIEAGPDQGKIIPQFQALGLTSLVLVGSVLMEYCYTIFNYRVVVNPSGTISLSPAGMYAFNKPGGPKIITQPSPHLELPQSIAPTRFI